MRIFQKIHDLLPLLNKYFKTSTPSLFPNKKTNKPPKYIDKTSIGIITSRYILNFLCILGY